MTFEAFFIPIPPHFISLGPGFAGSDGISGKLDLLCGRHSLLKSGGSPHPPKVIGFPQGFLEKGGEGKEPPGGRDGSCSRVLRPVGCKPGMKDFRAGASHPGRQYPRTREALWAGLGRGQSPFRFLQSMTASIYIFSKGSIIFSYHLLSLRFQEVSIVFKAQFLALEKPGPQTLCHSVAVWLWD